MDQQQTSATSYVYVIGPRYLRPVKIGVTTNLEKRLKSIQTGNPEQLSVLWATEGGRDLEHALHEQFAAERQAGEWFLFEDRDPLAAIVAAAGSRGRSLGSGPHRRPMRAVLKGAVPRRVSASPAVAGLVRQPGAVEDPFEVPAATVAAPQASRRARLVRLVSWYCRGMAQPFAVATGCALLAWSYGPSLWTTYGRGIVGAAHQLGEVVTHASATGVLAAVAVFFAVRTVMVDSRPWRHRAQGRVVTLFGDAFSRRRKPTAEPTRRPGTPAGAAPIRDEPRRPEAPRLPVRCGPTGPERRSRSAATAASPSAPPNQAGHSPSESTGRAVVRSDFVARATGCP